MPDLTGQEISNSYKRLMQVKTSANEGITTTLRTIQSGDNADSPLQLNNSTLNVNGTFAIGGVNLTATVSSLNATADISGGEGYVVVSGTNIYKRRISLSNDLDMNRNKLFNYLIQAFETERNTKIILEVQEYLKQKETKLVLYGYDSFLFDLKKKDGANILNDIKNILEKDNYPTKIKMGFKYSDMINITEKMI